MFTNQQNRATLAHNHLISVQCLYGEALVYHGNNTKHLRWFLHYACYAVLYIIYVCVSIMRGMLVEESYKS